MKKYLIMLLYYCDAKDDYSHEFIVLDINSNDESNMYQHIYDSGHTTFDDWRWQEISEHNWKYPTKY